MKTPRTDPHVRWLEARGWTRDGTHLWRHATLSPHGALAPDQAVRAQTRHERAEALADRDHSIAVVSENAGQDWMTAAVEAIRHTATYRHEFTVDDVEDDHPDLPRPHDGRAWGGATTKARDAGYIVATGRMDPSSRRSSHARRKLAWRSLLIVSAVMEVVG